MATYESGNAEGPPGRHPACGAGAGTAPRVRHHGSVADPQRRPGRPADRHGVSGPAPPGARRPGARDLVGGGRARPGQRAHHLAGLLRRRHRPPATRAAGGELAMNRQDGATPGAGPAVERYLAEIAALLPGPRRAHAGIVAELRSGLLDATDAHRSAGLPPAQAALAAIREFGDPARVAAGFKAEVAAGHARRVAAGLLATGPLVGLLWVATAVSGHLGVRAAVPWRWAGQSPGLRVGICLVAVAVGIPAWAAVLGIATPGP